MDDPEYLCCIRKMTVKVSEISECPRYLRNSENCTKTGKRCQVLAQCYDQDVQDIINFACDDSRNQQ